MSIAIGTYVSFEQRTGKVVVNAFQNFHAAETRTYEGSRLHLRRFRI